MSLARLLDAQPGVRASHELRPWLPWRVDPARAEATIRGRFDGLRARFPEASLVADVALFYLPYAPIILRQCPDARLVCLRRPRERVVASFIRKLHLSYGPNADHWRADRRGLPRLEWDACFPKYNVHTLAEGVGRYWDEYDRRASALAAEHPDRFRIFEMHHALNDHRGQHELFDFIGLPRSRRRIRRCHLNALATHRA